MKVYDETTRKLSSNIVTARLPNIIDNLEVSSEVQV